MSVQSDRRVKVTSDLGFVIYKKIATGGLVVITEDDAGKDTSGGDWLPNDDGSPNLSEPITSLRSMLTRLMMQMQRPAIETDVLDPAAWTPIPVDEWSSYAEVNFVFPATQAELDAILSALAAVSPSMVFEKRGQIVHGFGKTTAPIVIAGVTVTPWPAGWTAEELP